jgi:hypothetical protein
MSSEMIHPKMTFKDTLRVSPYAYAKWLWMRDRGNTEVAGYGVTGTEDPLLITDFKLIKQECTGTSFDLDTGDVAEYQDLMLDAGLAIWQSARILSHTHPGNSPKPSPADEKNFRRAFDRPDWAIMLIIAENGNAYCRLKVNVGPGIVKELKVAIAWEQPFNGTDTQAWEKEYKEKVNQITFRKTQKESAESQNMDIPSDHEPLWHNEPDDYFDEENCEFGNDGMVTYWDNCEGYVYYNSSTKQWFGENPDWEGDETIEIKQPNGPWAVQLIEWANERKLETEKVV